MRKNIWRILTLVFVVLLSACSPSVTRDRQATSDEKTASSETASVTLDPDAAYYERDEVALYIHEFGTLPKNYITKKEADERGWRPDDGSGLVIGGDRFGNREGLLPEDSNRDYYEADIQSGYTDHRGPERLVYSNDGYIFYTKDHYDSFEKLYEPEE